MEDEMTDNTSDRNGTSFTNKEMWVRVDGKLDAIMAKQGSYDIELAMLKERERENRAAIERLEHADTRREDDIAKALEKRNVEVDKKFESYDRSFNLIFKRLAMATGAVIAASAIFNIAAALIHSGFFH